MGTKFKDLNLNSSFLFAAALNDPETCQIVLELILGRTIPKVNVKTEHNILLSSDAKCVRLDVNARSEYDVNYKIVTLKKSREWEEGYMKFEELLLQQRKNGHSEGLCLGVYNSIIIVLSKKGDVTDCIKKRLEVEKNVDVLNMWLEKALDAATVDEFADDLFQKELLIK